MKTNSRLNNKKILILGGSHRDIPLIKAAQELGAFVITLGNKDYYLGHNYSNKFYKINFNDTNKIKEIIKKDNIDYLLPGSGEESYLNTVKISQELEIGNFDDLETAKLVHNKWQFKKFCLENSISTPKGVFYTQNTNIEKLSFPIVVKPTNLSGGRGVEVVHNKQELNISINNAKKVSNEIFLEEFIEGQLIAYSIFLQKQKIVYGFSGEDKTYLNEYLITTAYPVTLDNKVKEKLDYDIENLALLLKLVDGMFHLQILIKNNIPYIIDVTRRIPGDLYPNLIEYVDSIQYSKAVVKSYTTGIIDDEFKHKSNKQSFIIRHCVMPSKNGTYLDLVIDEQLKDKIIYRLDLIEKNTKIENFLQTQICILFIKLNEKEKSFLKTINEKIRVCVT
jgi:biotin carboxylase